MLLNSTNYSTRNLAYSFNTMLVNHLQKSKPIFIVWSAILDLFMLYCGFVALSFLQTESNLLFLPINTSVSHSWWLIITEKIIEQLEWVVMCARKFFGINLHKIWNNFIRFSSSWDKINLILSLLHCSCQTQSSPNLQLWQFRWTNTLQPYEPDFHNFHCSNKPHTCKLKRPYCMI